jgi:predicted RNA binding protein YcfA (HicA-like mRNA interferase family)
MLRSLWNIAPGRITIAGHLADVLAPGTLYSVLKQAGLKTRDD